MTAQVCLCKKYRVDPVHARWTVNDGTCCNQVCFDDEAATQGFVPNRNSPWSDPASYEPEPEPEQAPWHWGRWVILIFTLVILLMAFSLVARAQTVHQGVFCHTQKEMRALIANQPNGIPEVGGKPTCGDLTALMDSVQKIGTVVHDGVTWDIMRVRLIATLEGNQITPVNVINYIAWHPDGSEA